MNPERSIWNPESQRWDPESRGTCHFWENRKFWSENQMAHAIPIAKLQKLWAVIFDNVIFLLFLVCSADLDIVCSELSSHHVKFYSFNVYAQKFLDYE